MNSIRTCIRLIPAIGAILLLAGAGSAQQCVQKAMGPPPSSFKMHNESGSATIPFELSRGHIVLTAQVGRVTFKLGLDTGLPMDGITLFGGEKADKLDLAFIGKAQVMGAAGSDPIFADFAEGAQVELPNLTLTDLNVVVMPYDEKRNLVFEGEDGTIGGSIFSHLATHIDYDAMIITLTDPEKFSYSGSGAVVPLKGIGRGAPMVDLGVTLNDGTTFERTVVLDLGASHALALNTGEKSGISAPKNAVKRYLGTGVDGRLYGEVGRVKAVTIGDYTFENVVTSFSSLASLSCGPNSAGNLGNGIMQRFNITFDYANSRMILEPGQRFGAPFRFDMTGLTMERTPSGNYRAFEVLEGSPADQAGIQVDDVITAVNGKESSEVSRDELKLLVEGEKGKTLRLRIERGASPVEKTLELRDIV